MSTLKVVALISGGKDSVFSILHCIANGHEVVALANLYPAASQNGSTSEDTDSYMYQTIGHTVIPLYEQALGLPLYRQEILGSAVDTNKSYGPSPDIIAGRADETESLVPLLKKVKAAHPEVNAVSTGAILSDYQRTRVESVALRLGLTPLSYLWQYPSLPPANPTALLEDMAVVGQDSRIIKVASGGLDDTFLWQNVAEWRTIARLNKASMLFGTAGDGSALGEGGEYETLAVAGPAPLWKGRIVVDDDGMETALGEAGSASVRIAKVRIGPLENTSSPTVRIPDLLEERFERLLVTPPTSLESTAPEPNTDETDLLTLKDHWLVESLTGEGSNAAEQTVSIMATLQQRLSNIGHGFRDVAYTLIVLRDMADFAAVNKVYSKSFDYASPPARVTLACADVLPAGASLAVSATSVRSSASDARHGLHVQSRSYWAPANIGPYSQAITVPAFNANERAAPGIIYVAGQIPLIPASMDLYQANTGRQEDDFIHQAVLALQHLFRIGAAVKSRQWLHVIAFITASSENMASSRASTARRIWSQIHRVADEPAEVEEEDDDFDVWHQQNGQGRTAWQTQTEADNETTTTSLGIPPITAVEVDSLPRGASIEWAAYGSTESNAVCHTIPHLQHLLQVFGRRTR